MPPVQFSIEPIFPPRDQFSEGFGLQLTPPDKAPLILDSSAINNMVELVRGWGFLVINNCSPADKLEFLTELVDTSGPGIATRAFHVDPIIPWVGLTPSGGQAIERPCTSIVDTASFQAALREMIAKLREFLDQVSVLKPQLEPVFDKLDAETPLSSHDLTLLGTYLRFMKTDEMIDPLFDSLKTRAYHHPWNTAEPSILLFTSDPGEGEHPKVLHARAPGPFEGTTPLKKIFSLPSLS